MRCSLALCPGRASQQTPHWHVLSASAPKHQNTLRSPPTTSPPPHIPLKPSPPAAHCSPLRLLGPRPAHTTPPPPLRPRPFPQTHLRPRPAAGMPPLATPGPSGAPVLPQARRAVARERPGTGPVRQQIGRPASHDRSEGDGVGWALTGGGGGWGVVGMTRRLGSLDAASGANWPIATSLPLPSLSPNEAAVLVRRFCFSIGGVSR